MLEKSMKLNYKYVLNENIRFTEISKDNFWSKIDANKTGEYFAKQFLAYDPTGQSIPIQLVGTLDKERYFYNGDIIKNSVHFNASPKYNSFLIEKVYEELLLEHGRAAQDALQKFFYDFGNTLMKSEYVKFAPLNLVDYDVIERSLS